MKSSINQSYATQSRAAWGGGNKGNKMTTQIKFFRTPHFNNSKAKRDWQNGKVHAFPVHESNVNEWYENGSFYEVTPPIGVSPVAYEWKSVDDFVCGVTDEEPSGHPVSDSDCNWIIDGDVSVFSQVVW